ncbi:MAG: peptidase S41 [Acidobacteria bacterium]|nr:peptidase S41 [Acidobacteriota bacterium]
MKLRASSALLTLIAVISLTALPPSASGNAAIAPDPDDTRMLAAPAISATHVAFIYAGDLWSARLDGSDVRRLTTHVGQESWPVFSPDGDWIAFSAQYDGNLDVYIVPTRGGEPRRLTWHPGPDLTRDWTPDGSAVLFASQRAVHTNRHLKLHTVSVDGGMPEELPIPYAFWASYSGDGSHIAYTHYGDRHLQWKNYRGGTQARIWIYDTADHGVADVMKPAGGSNDTEPMWLGDRMYFLSDRAGEFNLFSSDMAGGIVTQHTFHDDFPVLHAKAGGGQIVYEQGGYLFTWAPGSSSRTGERLRIGVAADLIERRSRWIDGAEWIRGGSVSPSGARVALEYRGDIVTVPADKGDVRNLTASSSAHDRSPAWSPDGQTIAWFSDAGDAYRLHVGDPMGRDEPRVIDVEGAGYYEAIDWAPDGTKLTYTDNAMALWLLDLETEQTTQIAKEPYYGPFKTISGSWSPDSAWIAYTVPTEADFRQVWLFNVADGSRHPITDGLSDAFFPVFDGSGKYLYFLASTEAGPVRGWFAMSNADMSASSAIYLAVLEAGAASPLKRQSDEEPVASDSDASDDEDAAEDTGVEFDLENVHQRIVALPVGEADYSYLEAGQPGKLFYLHRQPGQGYGEFGGPGTIKMFDLGSREETSIGGPAFNYTLSGDGSKLMAVMPGGQFVMGAADAPLNPAEGALPVDRIRVRIDPVEEWAQIYREVWRINRDWFYDPGMHGSNWDAMGEKYSDFLGALTSRADLNRLLRWLQSELAVGHSNTGGGDFPFDVDNVQGGLLGADFVVDSGRYQVEKIYGGLNWNPNLRSPLTEPGVDVKEGEYVIAVDGEDVAPPTNLYSFFENTANTSVELTVSATADGADARTVSVVPVNSDYALRNRDWVEGNIAKVDAATDGRVAYVYVPNTTGQGHEYFKRYFFPQAHKDAIIVDERYNGGGQVADYYIDILRRPYISHWATRYGGDYKTPFYSIQGPKVMIIDETAGSGGDLLPWMFNKLELGPLVGKRTWGGLVGMLGFPVLLDGGGITSPNLGIWTEEGFIVENVGVPPDYEVEQTPADVIAGHDPQLEKAIELALEELAANPPKEYKRPPFPTRVRQQ